MAELATILLVEPHALLREGLALILEREEGVRAVLRAASGVEALQALQDAPVDMVLLDLALPRMSGLELCEAIRARHEKVRIVLLTDEPQMEEILEGLRAGACGFIPKDVGVGEFVRAVRSICRDTGVAEAFLGKRLLAEIMRSTPPPPVPGPPEGPGRGVPGPLSRRELEILKRVVAGRSSHEIAAELAISSFTVANHLKNVYRKLGVKDRTQAVLAALNRGLL